MCSEIFFVMQNIFYIIALSSFAFEKLRYNLMILCLPYYFTLINLASARTFVKFAFIHKHTIWTPRKGI